MSDDLASRRRALLEEHLAHVVGDSPFQARLRLQQSLWREAQDLPAGAHRGAVRGAWLTEVDAAAGANFVDPAAVARADVDEDGLVDDRRLRGNLLSSQPLAFNLFATLAQDLEAASKVLRHLLPMRINKVTAIRFEHSPGRGDASFLGNRSAFDVHVDYRSMDNEKEFLGIEVKYHEDLHDAVPGERRPRYQEVADASRQFRSTRDLWRPPLWQLWLDHLLVLSCDRQAQPKRGTFVLLAPAGNLSCWHAFAQYRQALVDPASVVALTVEDVLAVLPLYCSGAWVTRLWDRYGDASSLLSAGWPMS